MNRHANIDGFYLFSLGERGKNKFLCSNYILFLGFFLGFFFLYRRKTIKRRTEKGKEEKTKT